MTPRKRVSQKQQAGEARAAVARDAESGQASPEVIADSAPEQISNDDDGTSVRQLAVSPVVEALLGLVRVYQTPASVSGASWLFDSWSEVVTGNRTPSLRSCHASSVLGWPTKCLR
jgi:hypothetical protein